MTPRMLRTAAARRRLTVLTALLALILAACGFVWYARHIYREKQVIRRLNRARSIPALSRVLTDYRDRRGEIFDVARVRLIEKLMVAHQYDEARERLLELVNLGTSEEVRCHALLNIGFAGMQAGDLSGAFKHFLAIFHDESIPVRFRLRAAQAAAEMALNQNDQSSAVRLFEMMLTLPEPDRESETLRSAAAAYLEAVKAGATFAPPPETPPAAR